ncbi:hypothetical protein ElyMa_005445700 [Elysia marginata]|uniref:Uncharacterized protein n=1 Tax=Elysia marginata TaxID=1093978 RepID=A0AAV4EN53_9GAST|nr:hypothetical protein ElyMa_005445700 [Elysia marginata]
MRRVELTERTASIKCKATKMNLAQVAYPNLQLEPFKYNNSFLLLLLVRHMDCPLSSTKVAVCCRSPRSPQSFWLMSVPSTQICLQGISFEAQYWSKCMVVCASVPKEHCSESRGIYSTILVIFKLK